MAGRGNGGDEPPVRLALACFTSGDRDPEHTAGSSPGETFIKLVPRTTPAPTTASGKSQHADDLDSGSPSATARSIVGDCNSRLLVHAPGISLPSLAPNPI
jgi:hypothetical protein